MVTLTDGKMRMDFALIETDKSGAKDETRKVIPTGMFLRNLDDDYIVDHVNAWVVRAIRWVYDEEAERTGTRTIVISNPKEV